MAGLLILIFILWPLIGVTILVVVSHLLGRLLGHAELAPAETGGEASPAHRRGLLRLEDGVAHGGVGEPRGLGRADQHERSHEPPPHVPTP